MKAFAELLDGLIFSPGRNAKLALIERYFAEAPDPDRGYALAALAGTLAVRTAKPALIREIVSARVDPVLFALSYDFVGDLAETAALIWPAEPGANRPPELAEVVERLHAAKRGEAHGLIAGWLDALDPTGRWAVLKLVTGGLRVGVSARLAKTALARWGGLDLAAVEEVWHALDPPYAALFAWAEGRAGPPAIDRASVFRSLMLAHPLEEGELDRLDPADFLAEWKWDGIRVQLVGTGDPAGGRVFSRTGDDISRAFPDIADGLTFDAVLDGELLVARDGAVAPFNDLQQRLGRKTVTARMRRDYPGHVRLYDILFEDGTDLRGLAQVDRRARLEAWFAKTAPGAMDLSALVPFDDWARLGALRDASRAAGIEGLMLKRHDTPYRAGRPKGPWFKWKRAALSADCVIMYAQRGHGKRSSFYSDFTFGAWRDGPDGAPELVPVGKAYSGFTDAELKELDRFVRRHTTDRFGPVRAVAPRLVVEVAFDAVQRSTRHKSGIAMRFPRFHRLRWDKPAQEADRLETLLGMLD